MRRPHASGPPRGGGGDGQGPGSARARRLTCLGARRPSARAGPRDRAEIPAGRGWGGRPGEAASEGAPWRRDAVPARPRGPRAHTRARAGSPEDAHLGLLYRCVRALRRPAWASTVSLESVLDPDPPGDTYTHTSPRWTQTHLGTHTHTALSLCWTQIHLDTHTDPPEHTHTL